MAEITTASTTKLRKCVLSRNGPSVAVSIEVEGGVDTMDTSHRKSVGFRKGHVHHHDKQQQRGHAHQRVSHRHTLTPFVSSESVADDD